MLCTDISDFKDSSTLEGFNLSKMICGKDKSYFYSASKYIIILTCQECLDKHRTWLYDRVLYFANLVYWHISLLTLINNRSYCIINIIDLTCQGFSAIHRTLLYHRLLCFKTILCTDIYHFNESSIIEVLTRIKSCLKNMKAVSILHLNISLYRHGRSGIFSPSGRGSWRCPFSPPPRMIAKKLN